MAPSKLHEEIARKAWSECCQMFIRSAPLNYAKLMRQDHWRQPLQFLATALFYSWRGIRDLPDDKFHEPLVPTPAAWEDILPKKPDIPDPDDLDLRELFGTAHLASASFRLSSGLLKVHGLSPFNEFLRPDRGEDWNRRRLQQFLDVLPNLGCCGGGWAMVNCEEVAAVRLTVMLAHRDNFGHGEDPDLSSKWSQERQAKLWRVYRCRLAEVQLLLICWGLSQLKQYEV